MDPGIIAIVFIIAVVLWFLLRGKPAALFVVHVQDGAAITKEGKVTAAFLDEITEQCLVAGIRSGELRGLPRGRRISLWFSPEFPPDLQQRLRNWWGVHGWAASPRPT